MLGALPLQWSLLLYEQRGTAEPHQASQAMLGLHVYRACVTMYFTEVCLAAVFSAAGP